MARYKLVVLSNPTEGQEEEYHHWYQHVHLPQVIACDGFVSAQRFKLAADLTDGKAKPYLAIYEIETDDLTAMLAAVAAKSGTELLSVSEAIDTATAYTAVYEEFGPVVGS